MNPTSMGRMAPLHEAGYDGMRGPDAGLRDAGAAQPRELSRQQEPIRVQYTFGQYVFDPQSGELNDGQKTVQLRPQVGKLLELLLRKANTTVSREDIKNHLWGSHIVVEFEEGISACVRQLRIALNDGAAGTRYIQTISRRGYKFVYPVTASEDGLALERRAQAAMPLPPTQPATPSQVTPAPRPPRAAGPWRYLAALAVLAVVVAAVSSLVYQRRDANYIPGAGDEPSTVVAVLPFNNLSQNQDGAVLGASLSNEVINLLGPIAPERLGVIASTSTAHYLKGGETIKQIGQELGANYVLEGSITPQAGGYHISARLIRAADQSYVWGDEYDLDSNYSAGAYKQLVIRIATQVAGLLVPNAAVKPLQFTNNRDAAVAFQTGRYQVAQGDLAEGYADCQKAIGLDPGFAAAYDCAARALLRQTEMTPDKLKDARALVAKGASLDSSSAESRLLQGQLAMYYDWNLNGAGAAFKESLRLNPGDAWAWQSYAEYLVAMSRKSGMQNAMDTARALDPVSVGASDDAALVAYLNAQYPQAESGARTNAGLNPDDTLAQHLLTLSLLGGGKYAAAVQQAAVEMRALHASAADVAKVQARHGSLVNYFQWYVAHAAHAPADRYSAVFLADAYMHLGQADQAFAVLSTTVKQRAISTLVPFLSVWPSLKPLCTRPDFLTLTTQLGQAGCLPQ
ncbi:MAG TPA: winged helix-turn-helix domain-containing protein [Gammaproteobacteria bacterium]|nr:winged helix-turn-helix domain-containing protein [Gammaproteobacteria bacterium]